MKFILHVTKLLLTFICNMQSVKVRVWWQFYGILKKTIRFFFRHHYLNLRSNWLKNRIHKV